MCPFNTNLSFHGFCKERILLNEAKRGPNQRAYSQVWVASRLAWETNTPKIISAAIGGPHSSDLIVFQQILGSLGRFCFVWLRGCRNTNVREGNLIVVIRGVHVFLEALSVVLDLGIDSVCQPRQPSLLAHNLFNWNGGRQGILIAAVFLRGSDKQLPTPRCLSATSITEATPNCLENRLRGILEEQMHLKKSNFLHGTESKGRSGDERPRQYANGRKDIVCTKVTYSHL